jgi:hypothetical protein
MLRIWKLIACSIAASLALFASAMAQNLEVKRYNPSEWTKGRFSEIVTVNGPGKTIYLAGIGAEEENAPGRRQRSDPPPWRPLRAVQIRLRQDQAGARGPWRHVG